MGDGYWKPVEDVKAGDAVIGFDLSKYRRNKFCLSRVEQVFEREAPVVRLRLESGKIVYCTEDHHWFTGRHEPEFRYMPPKVGRSLVRVAEPFIPEPITDDYRLGYVRGLTEGDGCVTDKKYTYKSGSCHIRNMRLAMKDVPILDRFVEFSGGLGLSPRRGHACGLPCVRVYGAKALEVLVTSIPPGTSEYWRGWLAGIFDAEGSVSGSLRISQYPSVHPEIYARIGHALSLNGFESVAEGKGWRVLGGREMYLKFWETIQPVMWEKLSRAIISQKLLGKKDKVVRIESVGKMPVYSLRTSTANYIGQGYASRNCFSQYQKGGAMHPVLRWVDPKKIARMFTNPDESAGQFGKVLRERYAVQWGGLSDPFCKYEQKHGVSLGLLRMFGRIGYPISISTKGAWIKDRPEYMEALVAARDTLHMKVSIINLDKDRARRVELGVPSPAERLDLIEAMAKAGIPTTLRLRPFIHGISDRGDEYIDLVYQAVERGALNVSFEFFCLELRKAHQLKRGYKNMSAVAGRDLVAFYRKFSKGGGYLRLSRAVKLPITERLAEACDKAGVPLLVSDAHVKDFSAYPACCGIPTDWKRFDNNFFGALMKAMARKNGRVRFKDIDRKGDPLKEQSMLYALGLNTRSSIFRAHIKDMSLFDYMHEVWNQPDRTVSPCMYFQCMKPVDDDKDGDVVYEYTPNGRRDGEV